MEKAQESDEIYRTPTPVAPKDATWQQVQEFEVKIHACSSVTFFSLFFPLITLEMRSNTTSYVDKYQILKIIQAT